MTWRLLVDGASRGSWNMAVDQALAESVDSGASPPVLRLYRWDPACLSLGFAQPFAAAAAEFCARKGVDVVRRPTGGRAVLHHLELTYAVLASLDGRPFAADLQAAYRRICRALVAGLRLVGVPAGLAGTPQDGMIRPIEAIPCFVGPATGEVVAAGRKLVGSAMRRMGATILQHGSILESWDGPLQAGCLGLPDDSSLRPAVVTVHEIVGGSLPVGRLEQAMAAGFATEFGIEADPSFLTAAEVARADELVRERYAHPRWTIHRERGQQTEGVS
jgi:lipoate-protein ligase A